MALTGRSGVPVVKASTSNEFQPNTRSAGGGEAAPPRVATRASPTPAAAASAAFHPPPHRLRQRRAPLGHLDRSARVGDAGERLREHDAGIGNEAAPVARVMTALAQVD